MKQQPTTARDVDAIARELVKFRDSLPMIGKPQVFAYVYICADEIIVDVEQGIVAYAARYCVPTIVRGHDSDDHLRHDALNILLVREVQEFRPHVFNTGEPNA